MTKKRTLHCYSKFLELLPTTGRVVFAPLELTWDSEWNDVMVEKKLLINKFIVLYGEATYEKFSPMDAAVVDVNLSALLLFQLLLMSFSFYIFYP